MPSLSPLSLYVVYGARLAGVGLLFGVARRVVFRNLSLLNAALVSISRHTLLSDVG